MIWSVPSALVTLVFGLLSPFLNSTTKTTSPQYTTVIAPRAIRSNSEFTISLAVVTESFDPITFQIKLYERLEPTANKSLDYVPNDIFVSLDPHNDVRIYGPAFESPVTIVADSFSADNRSAVTDYKVKTVIVWPHVPKVVNFKLGDVLPGNYNLDVESLNTSLVFHENYFLYVESKTFSIFIETDKAIFKPGDVMRYRVLLLDSDTRPINVTNGLNISIYDATNNLVHLRTQLSAKNGVFAGVFETMADDVIGVWEIEAQYSNQRVKKSIECSDQDIPNFQVVIKTPQKVTNLVTLVVEAQYLFGKPVRGVATVSAIPVLSDLDNSWAKTAAPVTKNLEIDGSITVNFTLPSNLSFVSVLIKASVLNAATDVHVNATDKMIFSDTTASDFEIAINSFNFYLPGSPFSINVTVTSKSNRPLTDHLVEFLIAYDEEYLIDSIIEEHQLDANGTATIVVQIPDEVSQTVQFQVRYGKVKKEISFRVKHLHVQVVDAAATVRFQVGSRTPLSFLFYYVVGRGNILLSKSVDCKAQNFTTLEFDASLAMAPNCSLVVFYVAPNGTLVSDYTSFTIAPERWLTPLSVTVSNTILAINNEVTLTIESSSKSDVSLSLVDQGGSVLRRGNDLTRTVVYNDLQLYDNAGDVDLDVTYSESYVNMLLPGTIVMANAGNDIGGPPSSNISYMRRHANFDYSSDVLTSICLPILPTGEVGFLQNLKNQSITRSNTSDVLLWTDFTHDTERTTLIVPIPDKISSWRLSGFSLSSNNGLGLIQSPIVLTTFKLFFIDVVFPVLVQIDKVCTLKVAVHNYLNHMSQVVVFLDDSGGDFTVLTNKQANFEVGPDSVESTFFVITPQVLGSIRIRVQATSDIADDTVEKYLKVQPAGVTITRTLTKPVVLTAAEPGGVHTFAVNVPTNAVPGSVKIQAVVQGDKYSLDLINLPDPIPGPIGGGADFYFAFREFIASLRLKVASGHKGFEHSVAAQKAVDKLFSKQCADGGFRSDDDCDQVGRSTDYTAGILRAIYSARPFITVDTVALFKGFDFLASTQLADGSFSNSDSKPGSSVYSANSSLTAFVLYCFIDTSQNYLEIPVKYQATVHAAMANLFDQFDSLDILSSSLLWASTQLTDHPRKAEARLRIDRLAVKNEVTKRWLHEGELLEHAFEYTLAAVMHANDTVDALRIANGMLRYRVEAEARMSREGKVSILNALAYLHALYSIAIPELEVRFLQNCSDTAVFSIGRDNRFLQRKFAITSDTRTLKVALSGRGFVNLAVHYQYNLKTEDIIDAYKLEVGVFPGLFGERLLVICVSFIPTTPSPEVSVVEVSFPAGFRTNKLVIDVDLLTPELNSRELKDGKLIVELRNLGAQPTCFTVPLYREVNYVSQLLVGSVLVYDPAWTSAKPLWSRRDYSIPARDLVEM